MSVICGASPDIVTLSYTRSPQGLKLFWEKFQNQENFKNRIREH